MSFGGDGYQFKNDPVFIYDDTDPRPYAEQWETWLICRDTTACDISNYPGHGDEQRTKVRSPVVVTKRPR